MGRRSPFRVLRRFFRYFNAGVVLCCFSGGAFVAGALCQLGAMLPDTAELSAYKPRLTTEIYSTEVQRDGSETHTLLARVFREDRQPVELREIPPALVYATIAIEDRRFYTHRGISPQDMIRAAWIDLRHHGVRQGASTITQQLVRNIWLGPKRDFERKIKEAMLALEVERKYSKDEIMEMYLNQICYGHGAFGVRTAARLYFGKEVKDLKLHECALLAGLPKSPVDYSPYHGPERCKKRRDLVLAWMEKEGYITPRARQDATAIPITEGLEPLREHGVTALHAPYFTHLVIHELCAERGTDQVYEGGLRVYTTLDMRIQKVAEEELTAGVERLRRNGEIRRGLDGQGALACVETHTGACLAMVGGVGPYEQVQYNRAHPGPPRFGRQPGSSFKPYIWATALENGYGPDSYFSGEPISISLGPGTYWNPKNYSPHQSGTYSLRRALADSVNLVSVRIVQQVTRERVQRLAVRMLDIPPDRIRPVWAMALGASELSPFEQAAGYCCFANGGLRPTRRLIRRIEDYEGQLQDNYSPELVRVLRPDVASSMLSMLQTVVSSGTGTRAEACGLPCGGKTGTTNSGRDVWWVGFTPDLSCAVWVGNDGNAPMPSGTGGGFCAPIWAKFIRRATDILNVHGKFPQGEGVHAEHEGEPAQKEGRFISVCTETGMLATPGCPSIKEVYLEAGKDPPGPCTRHGALLGGSKAGGEKGGFVNVRICPASGMLATENCPATRLKRFRVGEEPTQYCTLHGGAPRERPTPTPGGGETPAGGGKPPEGKKGSGGEKVPPAPPGKAGAPPADGDQPVPRGGD